MLYHTQRYSHDPANGIYGDCHRTAYACVLDLPLDEVPNFADGDADAAEFHRRCDAWLAKRGLCRFIIPIQDAHLQDWQEWIAERSPHASYILGGRSQRGFDHSVVCRGGKIIHDPYIGGPDDGAVVGPCSDGVYWVELFTPLSADTPLSPDTEGKSEVVS